MAFAEWWERACEAADALSRDASILDRTIVDAYGNHHVIGGNLDRVVTVGAGFRRPGVQVRTGLTGRGTAILLPSGEWRVRTDADGRIAA